MTQDASTLETEYTLSPERIARKYAAGLDSVDLINKFVAFASPTQEQIDRVSRNQEHLKYLVSLDCWTTEDLAPMNKAIATATPFVAE